MIRLYNIDMMKFRLDMVRNFDVMYTDPPYSEHVHKSAVSQSKTRGARKRHLGFEHLTPEGCEKIGAFVANVKRWSLVYSDVESTHLLTESATKQGATYIRTLPWIRWSMAQLSGDRPPSGMEHVANMWGRKEGTKSWTGPNSFTHFRHKCLRGEGKHKAAKPLDQCLDVVSWFSKPGEIIFDPFAGHSPIGVACMMLGRGYVGLEIDENCWWKGAKRLAMARRMKLSASDKIRVIRWLSNNRYEPKTPGKSRLALIGTAARKYDKDRVRAQWGHVLGI